MAFKALRGGVSASKPLLYLSLLPITQTVLCSVVHPVCCHLPCMGIYRLCEDSSQKVTVDHLGLSRQFWIPSYPRVILDRSSLIHSFIPSCLAFLTYCVLLLFQALGISIRKDGYGLGSPRAYRVAGKAKMKQRITVKSDECHEVEIREVMRGYILQGNFYLLSTWGDDI